MLWRDLQSVFVGKRPNRSRLEYDSLLGQIAHQSISNLRDLFSSEHSDQRVNLWTVFKQLFFLPFRQTACDDNTFRLASFLEGQHFVDRTERLSSRLFDKPTRIHHNEISVHWITDQLVAIKFEQAHHSFAIDCVFWAAQTDKRIGSLNVFCFWEIFEVSRQNVARTKIE